MAGSDLDLVIAEQNLKEDAWNDYKKEVISNAVKVCEKYNYPAIDEPLCCLLEDVLDNARQHLTDLHDSSN